MENGEKRNLRNRFAVRYGMSRLSARDLIVLHGKCGVTVYGCQRILHYSPREIRLDTGRRGVSVTGERLYCSSFTVGTVIVEGIVEGVRYFSVKEPTEDQRKGSAR